MREFLLHIQVILSAIGAFLGWFFGGTDGFLYVLIAFVIIDYITGIINALISKALSSEVGFKGICKKVLIFILVGVAHLIDLFILQEGIAIRTAVIFFYIANEGISILENSAKIGLPIPKKLKKVLTQINKRSGE
jgi:toxin secretion/phage lysis holin